MKELDFQGKTDKTNGNEYNDYEAPSLLSALMGLTTRIAVTIPLEVLAVMYRNNIIKISETQAVTDTQEETAAPSEKEIKLSYVDADTAIKTFIVEKYQRRAEESRQYGEKPERINIYLPEACMYREDMGEALKKAAFSEDEFLANTWSAHLDGKTDFATNPGCKKKIRHKAFFIGPWFKQQHSMEKGEIDFVTLNLYEAACAIREGTLDEDKAIDTAILQVSRPFIGEDGEEYVSVGLGAVVTMAAVENILEQKENGLDASIICFVNDEVPQTNARIKVSKIDAFVGKLGKNGKMERFHDPLPEHKTEKQDEVSIAIAKNVLKLIPSGETEDDIASIQLGIGPASGVADEIAKSKRIKRVRAHTELATDSYMKLDRAHKIVGKIVTGFANGTKEFYRYVQRHPERFDFRSGCYVNNPDVIKEIPNVYAINSALGVDFRGNIFATTVRREVEGEMRNIAYGGIGGQPDFAEGARKSKGGKFIVMFKSSRFDKNSGELVSTILPDYGPGEFMTETAYLADVFCTEWGTAKVRHSEEANRARELIKISHPLLCVQLFEKAVGRYLFKSEEVDELYHDCQNREAEYKWTVKTFKKEVFGDKQDRQEQLFGLISQIEDPDERAKLTAEANTFNAINNIGVELMKTATKQNSEILAKISTAEPIERLHLVHKAMKEGLELPQDLLERLRVEAKEQKKRLARKNGLKIIFRRKD